MARTVYLHIGLPKTGTTYVQSILWPNREILKAQQVLLPGRSSRHHLLASVVVREDPSIARRGEHADRAWAELVQEVRGWPHTAIISHEFFAGASKAQVADALAELAPAEVHLVVTARDPLSLLSARWQEYVKHGWSTAIDDYPPTDVSDPQDEWGWSTMDLGDVLRRWTDDLPPERVHVLVLPRPTDPPETLWTRFATVTGIDPVSCARSRSQQNESLGVVEVELLRRVDDDLLRYHFRSGANRGTWIRGYLAQQKLVPRKGEKFWPAPERVEAIRGMGDDAVDLIRERGFDVVGELDDLRVPAELPVRRHPSSVTDSELLTAATGTIASMLTDVRRLTVQAEKAEAALREASSREGARLGTPKGLRRRAAGALSRTRHRARDRVRRMWSRS